ncbi:acyl-CoA dehydrogenase domain protein [Mycobacterium xenopi 3993]|nr:acyl-CoA dehydrogenase domain protein [Mycobacterium xenopi 3993]
MDVRLTAEQQQLRDAAAKFADDLGPGSVQALDDNARIARLDKQIEATGWRSLRSDGASGVEVAIIAEEFGRGWSTRRFSARCWPTTWPATSVLPSMRR